MRTFLTRRKLSLPSLLLITGACIFLFGPGQSIRGQACSVGSREIGKKISFELILETLKRETITCRGKEIPVTVADRNAGLVALIKKRGIELVLTEEDEQALKDAGANESLVTLVVKESEKLEKTSWGKGFLAKRFLDVGKKFREEEQGLSYRARDLRRQKNAEEAQKLEDEAKKKDEEAAKNLEKAITYLREALELDPENLMILNNLGVAYLNLKNYDEAIPYFSRVINNEPTEGRYFNRAVVYENKAKTAATPADKRAADEKAIEDYSNVIRLNPCSKEAYERRAELYRLYRIMDKYEADMQELEQIKARKKNCTFN